VAFAITNATSFAEFRTWFWRFLRTYYGSLPIIYTNIKINTMYDIKLKHEVLATIDELNQYLLGNVTIEAATDAARELTHKLNEQW